MAEFTIDELAGEAKRELAVRKRVYAAWVAQRRMTQPDADRRIALMQAIVDNLEAQRPQKELALS